MNFDGPAELSLVDFKKSLEDLRQQNPTEFEFLANCMLEYAGGPYRSTHPVCKIASDGEIIPVCFCGLINNKYIINTKYFTD